MKRKPLKVFKARNPKTEKAVKIKLEVSKNPPEPTKKPPKKRSGLRIRIDPLDQLFSEFVRRRAVQRVGGCEYCLKPHRWQDLQNSHFFGRGDRSTRFDEDDCAGLCFFCHNHFHAHPLLHVQWFERHLGKEAFELLQGRNRILEKPDKKMLTIYFQQKIKELDNLT